MGVGTSMGAYYDDAFHHAVATWDPKYDDNDVKIPVSNHTGFRQSDDMEDRRREFEHPRAANTLAHQHEEDEAKWMDEQFKINNKKWDDVLKGNVPSDTTKKPTDVSEDTINRMNDLFKKLQMPDFSSHEPDPNPNQLNSEAGLWDTYNTPLSAEDEPNFQKWKAENAPNDSGVDYDLRGAYAAGLTKDIQSGHWPDTYKKPNHPTFSDESIYAKDRPDLAGTWTGENHDIYISPEDTNVK